MHVYAANPMISPTDIDRFMPADDAPNAVARMQGRWFGFLLPLKPGMLAAARDMTRGWNNGDSPFNAPLVQHGRVVAIEIEGVDFLMVSMVFAADRSNDREIYSRKQTSAEDTAIVRELLGGPRESLWRTLLSCTTASFTNSASIENVMLKNRYGHRSTGPIRWVDWSWSFSPQIQRRFWQSGELARTAKPTESVVRIREAPSVRFDGFLKFGFDVFRAKDDD
jgi:hypothetical protein